MTYSHLIEIDRETRMLSIYRVFASGGEKQLYTSMTLPADLFTQDKAGFDFLARMLGENILLDSPAARDILGI